MLEQELKKVYLFFVQQERELYLKINIRLHARKKYESFSFPQIKKELKELNDLSKYAGSISSYIHINITALSKILKKFDKKFSRYNLNFAKKFIIEKYQKKNSDLLYIYQYKILDEVGACVEQLHLELEDQYYYLLDNPLKEENNSRANSIAEIINKLDKPLLREDIKDELSDSSGPFSIKNEKDEEKKLSKDEIKSLKNKFHELKESIKTMEILYQATSKIFGLWKIYLKKNDYKSHIYFVQSAGIIYDNSDSDDSENSLKKMHYLSKESYWNIRIILIQALVMSICSTYILPTIYYLLKSNQFTNSFFKKDIKRGFLCGFVISMSPIGGLISMAFSNYFIKFSYKKPMIISSLLSILGNCLFVYGIKKTSVALICTGRLITGFSLNTPVHRNYLIYFIPKRRMSKYLLYFKLTVLIGNSLGPLLSCFCLFIFSDDIHNFINKYTTPGMACFFVSIILLILIIILFSEPFDSKFVIYAKGQSPTEVMKRGGSFSIDNNLTIYESEKLNEINQKVSNFNDENQFNDTNLVALTINELIEAEVEPFGTVRKAFRIIMSYEFIISFTKFCYITMAPAYLYFTIYEQQHKEKEAQDKNKDLNHNHDIKELRIISALYSLSLFLIIPMFCLNFFYLSMVINKILYIKIVSLFFMVSEVSIISTLFSDKAILFYFIFVITILLAYVVEDQIIYFYTHIIPTNFKVWKLEGLTILHIIKYLGYIAGSSSSLFGYIFKENVEKDNLENFMAIQNSFCFFVQAILLVLFFINSDRFSDRPIRRILYSKNRREIRITEF